MYARNTRSLKSIGYDVKKIPFSVGYFRNRWPRIQVKVIKTGMNGKSQQRLSSHRVWKFLLKQSARNPKSSILCWINPEKKVSVYFLGYVPWSPKSIRTVSHQHLWGKWSQHRLTQILLGVKNYTFYYTCTLSTTCTEHYNKTRTMPSKFKAYLNIQWLHLHYCMCSMPLYNIG